MKEPVIICVTERVNDFLVIVSDKYPPYIRDADGTWRYDSHYPIDVNLKIVAMLEKAFNAYKPHAKTKYEQAMDALKSVCDTVYNDAITQDQAMSAIVSYVEDVLTEDIMKLSDKEIKE